MGILSYNRRPARRSLFLLLVFLSPNLCVAQLETSWCYFGFKAGIEFTQGSPQANTQSQGSSDRGAASMSDSVGDLLFYFSDDTIWNANHTFMPNGTGLFTDAGSEQSTVAVPRPNSNDHYFVFTTDNAEIWNTSDIGLFYHLIDMSLQSGVGDVVSGMKNIVLIDSTSEKIAATLHGNGIDYWVIVQQCGSNKYHAFLVTESGVSTSPVTSSMGPNMGSYGRCEGQLRFSHRGHLFVNTFSDDIAIFDFDNATGQLSNLRLMNDIGVAYGAEFSADDTKLYTGGPLQFDVTLPTAAAIQASMVPIYLSSNGLITTMEGMQYGLDGKIYGNNFGAAAFSIGYMAVINDPNASGFACGYQDSAVYLDGRNAGEVVPNFPSNFFATNFMVSSRCLGDTSQFKVNYHFIDSVLWNFGDPTSGVNDTSTNLSPYHIFTDTGLFTITLIAQNGAVTDSVVKTIRIEQPPAIDLGLDLEFCLDSEDSVKLSANGVAGDYLWNTGSMDSILWVLPEELSLNVPQAFTLVVSNRCGADSDTVRITATAALQVDLGNDTNLCSDSLILVPAIFNENIWTRYQWSNGDSVKIIGISSTSEQQNTTTIKLTATNACGSDSDSVSITFLSQPDGVLPNDSIYCLDRPFYLLNPFSDGISYLWSDSSSGPDLRVDSSGNYWLLSFNQCDTLFDAFNVTFNGEPKVDLGNDTFLCPGAEVILRNLDKTASQNQTWLWNTTSTDSTLSVEFSGDHWIAQGSAQLDTSGLFILQATLKACKTSDSIRLFRKGYCPERCKPGISNVITPNGDGINDVLRINMLCKTSDLSLFIYNRWGQLVHQGSHAAHAWDGFVNGEPSAAGTYFFVLSFTDEDGVAEEYRGSFSLMR